MSKKIIQTFIFFDLETTGLINKNFMPKITELSLIAVSRNAMCNTINSLPRVLHKLVLPIDPGIEISKTVHKLTGLCKENIEDVQVFNCETYKLVVDFIRRLTAPTCFVAYNGNNFDYPIFLSEIRNINEVLNEEILSIDMLHLIKDFFANKGDFVEKVNDAQHGTSNLSKTDDVSNLLNDGYDKMLSDALDSVMNSNFNSNNRNESCSKSTINTPKISCCNKMQEINEKTPESQIIKLSNKNFQDSTRSSVKRRLNFTSSCPVNYKLSSVCKHIIGTYPENAHSAEGDCITMIRCAIKLEDYFIKWADRKAMPMINYS
ncbi:uncharacterized protein LOC128895043 [Hylaeus anthracinus]|uniref:uncharacterized protein LOC128895043 n=1 Tax=Hylaeus anthracinus TaxID=313031 RepID=UPI0023B9122E|nr:uncharacterized protein LOC128895043 [Hylaeus anthracinus]